MQIFFTFLSLSSRDVDCPDCHKADYCEFGDAWCWLAVAANIVPLAFLLILFITQPRPSIQNSNCHLMKSILCPFSFGTKMIVCAMSFLQAMMESIASFIIENTIGWTLALQMNILNCIWILIVFAMIKKDKTLCGATTNRSRAGVIVLIISQAISLFLMFICESVELKKDFFISSCFQLFLLTFLLIFILLKPSDFINLVLSKSSTNEQVGQSITISVYDTLQKDILSSLSNEEQINQGANKYNFANFGIAPHSTKRTCSFQHLYQQQNLQLNQINEKQDITIIPTICSPYQQETNQNNISTNLLLPLNCVTTTKSSSSPNIKRVFSQNNVDPQQLKASNSLKDVSKDDNNQIDMITQNPNENISTEVDPTSKNNQSQDSNQLFHSFNHDDDNESQNDDFSIVQNENCDEVYNSLSVCSFSHEDRFGKKTVLFKVQYSSNETGEMKFIYRSYREFSDFKKGLNLICKDLKFESFPKRQEKKQLSAKDLQERTIKFDKYLKSVVKQVSPNLPIIKSFLSPSNFIFDIKKYQKKLKYKKCYPEAILEDSNDCSCSQTRQRPN